jgi:hypothetical protein
MLERPGSGFQALLAVGTSNDSWILNSSSECFFHCRALERRERMNMRFPTAVALTRLWGLTLTERGGGGEEKERRGCHQCKGENAPQQYCNSTH